MWADVLGKNAGKEKGELEMDGWDVSYAIGLCVMQINRTAR